MSERLSGWGSGAGGRGLFRDLGERGDFGVGDCLVEDFRISWNNIIDGRGLRETEIKNWCIGGSTAYGIILLGRFLGRILGVLKARDLWFSTFCCLLSEVY